MHKSFFTSHARVLSQCLFKCHHSRGSSSLPIGSSTLYRLSSFSVVLDGWMVRKSPLLSLLEKLNYSKSSTLRHFGGEGSNSRGSLTSSILRVRRWSNTSTCLAETSGPYIADQRHSQRAFYSLIKSGLSKCCCRFVEIASFMSRMTLDLVHL